MSHEYLTVRHGVWQFYRRVPARFTHLDKRGTVKLSTKIKVAKDRTGIKASRVAARLNNTLEAYWRGLSEQNAANAMRAYDDAVKLARSFGVDYLQPAEWAQKPLHEVRARVQAVMADGRIEDPAKRKAILGGVERPRIMLSSLFSTYETIQTLPSSANQNASAKNGRRNTSARRRSSWIRPEISRSNTSAATMLSPMPNGGNSACSTMTSRSTP